jgi:hypothetical protein
MSGLNKPTQSTDFVDKMSFFGFKTSSKPTPNVEAAPSLLSLRQKSQTAEPIMFRNPSPIRPPTPKPAALPLRQSSPTPNLIQKPVLNKTTKPVMTQVSTSDIPIRNQSPTQSLL